MNSLNFYLRRLLVRQPKIIWFRNFYLPLYCKPQWTRIIFNQTSTSFHLSKPIFDVLTVKAPEFPDSISDGDLRWKKKPGDPVATDEVIGEVETDKVALAIHAPSAGVIKEFMQQEGAVIQSQAPLCTIETK